MWSSPISYELLFLFKGCSSFCLALIGAIIFVITCIDYWSIWSIELLGALCVSIVKSFSDADVMRGAKFWVSNLTRKRPHYTVVNLWTLIWCVSISFSSNRANDVLMLWVERIIITIHGAPAWFSKSPGVERGGFTIRWHLRDLLVVEIIIERHIWNLIIKLMVLDEISSGAFILLTVSFSKGVFLWGHIAVLTN